MGWPGLIAAICSAIYTYVTGDRGFILNDYSCIGPLLRTVVAFDASHVWPGARNLHPRANRAACKIVAQRMLRSLVRMVHGAPDLKLVFIILDIYTSGTKRGDYCGGSRSAAAASVYRRESRKMLIQELNAEWNLMCAENPRLPSLVVIARWVQQQARRPLFMHMTHIHLTCPPPLATPRLNSPRLTSPRLASPRRASPHLASRCLASPRLATPHLASRCLASPRLASPRLAMPRLTSPRLASRCLTSPRLAMPRLTSPRLASPRDASPRLTSPRDASPHLASQCLASPRLAMPRLTSPRLTSPRLTSPRLAWSRLASPRLASPHLASPGLASPGLASPRLASPRLASPRLAMPAPRPLPLARRSPSRRAPRAARPFVQPR
jgi:hypothetical protein